MSTLYSSYHVSSYFYENYINDTRERYIAAWMKQEEEEAFHFL